MFGVKNGCLWSWLLKYFGLHLVSSGQHLMPTSSRIYDLPVVVEIEEFLVKIAMIIQFFPFFRTPASKTSRANVIMVPFARKSIQYYSGLVPKYCEHDLVCQRLGTCVFCFFFCLRRWILMLTLHRVDFCFRIILMAPAFILNYFRFTQCSL